MSLPLDYHGKITWHGQTGLSSEQFQQYFVTLMATALEGAKGATTVIGNRVSFTGTLFSYVSKWNALICITKGYVEVETVGDGFVVNYFLSFKHLFVITFISIFSIFWFIGFADASTSIAEIVVIPMLVWFWLFGLNILIAIVGFHASIKQVLKSLSQ